ncbi:MAG: RidA family protein [Pseudomonadota bacterium]
MRALSPNGIHLPFSNYSHGIALPAGCRLIACSGQLGITQEGDVPISAQAQARIALENLEAILTEEGLDRRAIVRLNAYVTDRAHLAGYMAARNGFFEGVEPAPASTLMIVSGFARPEFHVEIECLAAAREGT